jgi:hypothetical protein
MKQTIFNRQGTEVGYNEGYSSTFKWYINWVPYNDSCSQITLK